MIVWIIFIILFVLFGAVFVVGFLLPKTYTNQGNLVLASSPDDVWNAIMDMEKLPVSGSDQHHVQLISEADDPPAWLIDMGSTQLTIQTIESEEPHKLVRVLADGVVPMTAHYEYHLSPMGSGTDLTIQEEGFIDNGTWHVPIFRIMVRMMPGAGLKLYCQQLVDYLGETAVPIINKKS